MSWRVDAVAGVMAVLQAQKTATPTQLRAVYSSRPGSFPEVPAAYIGPRDERITYTAGTRTRTLSGLAVVVVDSQPDAQQTGDRLDALVDLLVDRFTAAYAQVAGGNSILQLSSISDTDVDVGATGGPILYRGVILGFGDTFITEGRT